MAELKSSDMIRAFQRLHHRADVRFHVRSRITIEGKDTMAAIGLSAVTELPLPPLDGMAGEASSLAITSDEQKTLMRCERTIRAGWQTFVEVGNALLTIKSRRLYRADYPSFEAYCRSRWQYHRSYAYRLITAAQVVGELSTKVDTPVPTTEAQVKPLVGLAPDEMREAWAKACRAATSGRVTARLVARMAAQYRISGPALKRRFGRTQEGKPDSVTRCLAHALECLKTLETDLRAGQADLADLAYTSELRRLLHSICKIQGAHSCRSGKPLQKGR